MPKSKSSEADSVLALVGIIVAGVCREQSLAIGMLATLRSTLGPIWQDRLSECERLLESGAAASDKVLLATVRATIRDARAGC